MQNHPVHILLALNLHLNALSQSPTPGETLTGSPASIYLDSKSVVRYIESLEQHKIDSYKMSRINLATPTSSKDAQNATSGRFSSPEALNANQIQPWEAAERISTISLTFLLHSTATLNSKITGKNHLRSGVSKFSTSLLCFQPCQAPLKELKTSRSILHCHATGVTHLLIALNAGNATVWVWWCDRDGIGRLKEGTKEKGMRSLWKPLVSDSQHSPRILWRHNSILPKVRLILYKGLFFVSNIPLTNKIFLKKIRKLKSKPSRSWICVREGKVASIHDAYANPSKFAIRPTLFSIRTFEFPLKWLVIFWGRELQLVISQTCLVHSWWLTFWSLKAQ